ncbi:hypothetical protein RB594_008198 [Gaeumannomyces avenae]
MQPDCPLQHLPAELVLNILEQCSSAGDVFALASACQRLYNIWKTKSGGVLWRVFLKEMPDFDDALISARLGEQAREAEARRTIQSIALSPGDFSGHRRVPTLSEVKAARTFRHLVDALVIYTGDLDLEHPEDRADRHTWPRGQEDSGPESPTRMPEWDDGVRKALYRVLICGAALAGPYNEPLVVARASDDPAVNGLPGRFGAQEQVGMGLSDTEADFLDQFTVCSMQATPQDEEVVFGPLCDWLVGNILSDSGSRRAMADRFQRTCGRALCCRNRQSPGSCRMDLIGSNGAHSDAHLVVWEAAKMIWLYQHFAELLLPSAEPGPVGAPQGVGQDRLSKALAVFFGVFRAEDVALIKPTSTNQPDFASADLSIPEEGDHIELQYDDFSNIEFRASGVTLFADWIYHESGRSSVCGSTGHPVAPLRLKFFDYFLRKTVGLPIIRGSYRQFHDDFTMLVSNTAIFALDDVEGREPSDQSTIGFSDGSHFF